MNKRVLMILAGVVAFITAIVFIFFEIKKVPDVNWMQRYDINSKEPHGLWLFYSILEDVYGKDKVKVDYFFDANNYNVDSTTYVAIGNNLEYDYNEWIQMEEFIRKGGEVFLIGESIAFSGNVINVIDDSSRVIRDTTHLGIYDLDTSFTFINHEYAFDDTVNLYFTPPHITYTIDSLDTLTNHRLLEMDTLSIFSYLQIDSGYLYIHKLPQLFTNMASKQDFYNMHLDYVLSVLEHKSVVISKPASEPLADKSPLSVLLANKNFAAAYYTFLIAAFLFLIFASRRKQKPILIKEAVSNTSLEYVSTLSKLYELQGQPHKLVKRMEENFYQYVYRNFFIHKNDVQFAEVLSKKTKISIDLIESIVNDFKRIKRELLCEDSDLEYLYNKIEKFKQQSNDRR